MSHRLQNMTIKTIEIASDRKAMRFIIEGGDGPIIARADGDCCSSSWIEAIELPAMGFPAKVIAIEDLDLPGSYNDEDNCDCLKVYGLKINTDKGSIIIDFRNSSNGFYGGKLSWSDQYFYGGVYRQNVSNDDWVLFTETLEADQ